MTNNLDKVAEYCLFGSRNGQSLKFVGNLFLLHFIPFTVVFGKLPAQTQNKNFQKLFSNKTGII